MVFTAGGAVAGSIPGTALEQRQGNDLYSDSYVLRAAPGEAGQVITRPGMPVATALSRAGIGSYGYLTIPRPDGTTAYLPAADFAEPSPFEGGKPALFTVDAGVTRFFRPVTSDPDSVNAEDNISTVGGEPLTVGVHQGDVLTVKATASPTATAAGTPVHFDAAAEGGRGGGLAFEWSFGDGTAATGRSVEHSFSGSGTYGVRVTATGTDESGGESAPLNIVVGNPPTTQTPGATTTPQPTSTHPTGSPGKARAGRGGNAPTPQTAKPPNHPTSRPVPPVPPSQPSTPPSPSPLPTAPEESSGGDSPEPPICCSAESPPEDSTPPGRSHNTPSRNTPSPTAPSTARLVEGRLIGDDLGAAAPAEGAAAGQGSRSAPGKVAGPGTGIPLLALIVVALLVAGALFEWRGRRPSS
ncbi:MAG TPA: PKD domain-containing protein [Solirubrobacterales bacterium]|nr:PKD domain-containing protein [Solirubrobacterales bacterium]